MLPVINLNNADSVIGVLDSAAEQMRSDERRVGCCVHLPARGRLLASGDLHDNPFHLQRIIAAARLDASRDHCVTLQELIHGEMLINGRDFSYRMLVRAAQLILGHPDQVHVLLANHEIAQLTGKGVSKGAGNSVELFNDALAFTFAERSDAVLEAVGRFIRALPLAVMSEGGVMCAHSLPSHAMMPKFDPDVLDRALTDDDYRSPTGAAYMMTWGRDHRDEEVARLAEHWGVEWFCLGHQHVETGIEQRGPQIVVLNSDHEQGRVLPIDLTPMQPGEALLHAIPLSAIGETGQEHSPR